MSADQLGGPLGEYMAELIPRAARYGHRRFPQVPAEDFEQEMWARVLANPPKYRQLFDDARYGIIWAELRRAATKLGNEDDRYRRAVKAKAAGYSVWDEQFYSTGMLRVLLPVLIEAEFEPANAIERAASGTDAAGVYINSSEPGSAAENYMCMLIDVCSAFRKLTKGQQHLLETYYGVSQEDTEEGRWERNGLASSMGLTHEALRKRVERAMRALQHKLGGQNPWQRSKNFSDSGD